MACNWSCSLVQLLKLFPSLFLGRSLNLWEDKLPQPLVGVVEIIIRDHNVKVPLACKTQQEKKLSCCTVSSLLCDLNSSEALAFFSILHLLPGRIKPLLQGFLGLCAPLPETCLQHRHGRRADEHVLTVQRLLFLDLQQRVAKTTVSVSRTACQ